MRAADYCEKISGKRRDENWIVSYGYYNRRSINKRGYIFILSSTTIRWYVMVDSHLQLLISSANIFRMALAFKTMIESDRNSVGIVSTIGWKTVDWQKNNKTV